MSEGIVIPYFIKVRGCINCEVSKELKKKTGKEYGFDHELMVKCMFVGCMNYGYSLLHPYIDPEEIVRLALKDGSPDVIDGARRMLEQQQKKFGKFFQRLGIDIEQLKRRLGGNEV